MIINSNSLQNHIQEEVKQTNNLNNTLIEKELRAKEISDKKLTRYFKLKLKQI